MSKHLSYFLLFAIMQLGTLSCKTDGFKPDEISRIYSAGQNGIMSLFTINEKSDSLLLRQKARKVNKKHIGSKSLELLRKQMLFTVNDSLNQGLGIAAPQVGLSLQMIYVQRLDKSGEPFEVYYNPEIKVFGDSINSGFEGCLSVPNYRGRVDRSQNIVLSYLDSVGVKKQERINDFTAVIFQHEIDHINGVLYFDRMDGGFDALTQNEEF